MKKIVLLFTLACCMLPFTFSFAQVLDSPKRDGVFDKITNENRKPIPYCYVRESDVFWAKRIWRVIDFREKINEPFYYPLEPQNGRKSFMSVIIDALKEGSIIAYDATNSSNDEFLTPISPVQLFQELSKNDTFRTKNPNPPYNDTTIITKKEFRPYDVMRIRVKEDWFFDKERSVMDVRIIGICPVIEQIDMTTNEDKGAKPLFWIYYPDVRPLLAKSEVFNRFNDGARLTYEDVFWKRMFSSFIYKESNVFDRKIVDYAKGLDQQLESERIKNDVFEFEHSLWEY
jgi:gliding motility associated protien GldN